MNKILSFKKDFDANDWLQENPDALRDRLFELYDESVEELQKVSDDIQKEKDFQAEVQDFVNSNGNIPTGVIDEIKAATDLLLSFDVDNFDARSLSDEKFRRKLGLCNFYTFANSAIYNLTTVFIIKRKLTLQKIKLGVELKDTEKPLLHLSETDLRKIIKNATKSVETQHIEFNKEQEKKRREEYRQQKQAEEEQAKVEGLERLFQLKKMSPSPERNEEIRTLVNQICEWQIDRYGNPIFIKPDINNFDLIFRFDPVIEGLFDYDAFNRAIVFTKEPFWRTKSNPDFIGTSDKKKFTDSKSYIGEPVQTEDKHALANYLARTYGKINAYRQFERNFNEFAFVHSFHPVKQFFENLPKWDGVPRAERIFVDFLQADDTPYVREVTFKSFLAAIARVYYPGCNWQTMPIIQGKQGTGKSYLLQKLGGKWYTELFENLSDSHAMDAIEGALIVEMGELDSWHGVRANTIKSFVARSNDKRRKAYAIAKSDNPRTCVFFGTSNDTQLLPDLTGNRRFPVIKCHSEFNQVKYGLSDEYVLQFWAELTTKFYQMADEDGGNFNIDRLRFSDDTLQKIEEIAKDFISDDGLTGEIRAFLDTTIPYKPVWKLLSREERRKFFENGGSVSISEKDLLGRQFARRRPDEMQELEKVLSRANVEDDYSVKFIDGKFTFYGAVLRDSICASEVYSECFGTSDRRISVFKIAEILANELSKYSWTKERRKNSIYGYQPNTFVRNFEDVEELEIENIDNAEEVKNAVQTDGDVADDVTIVSSGVYVDDEEFLEETEIADDDFGQFHDLQ